MKSQPNEAEILFPDRQININGQIITVSEFTFLQGMQLNHIAQPLIAAIGKALTEDSEPGFSALSEIFATYSDALIELVSVSTGMAADDIASLSDTEGQMLLMTFWSVNKSFFINRLMLVKQEQALSSSASPKQSTH